MLANLERIRRKVRIVLILYGLCAVAAGGILSFLTVVTLDWLFWFPAAIRVFVGVLFFSGFALAAWHWVVRPWRTGLSLAHIAGKVERHFGSFDDRLNSAVYFLSGAESGSKEMMAEVVERAEHALSRVDLHAVISLRPLMFRVGTLVIGSVVIVALTLWAEWWPSIGLHRYAFPLSDLRWPRRVEIDRAMESQLYVPFGESLVLNARILHGWDEQLRAVVHLRDEEGSASARTMNRVGEAHYGAVIDGITSDLSLWFEAGDDTTEDKPVHVVTVFRPLVEQVWGRVHPPPYTGRTDSLLLDMNSGTISATVGSRIEILIKSSKPLGDDSHGLAAAELRFENEEVLGLSATEEDMNTLSTSFSLDGERTFRVFLLDRHGFSGGGDREYRLIPTRDRLPTVSILEPKSVTEVTPQSKVSLSALVEDDFGVISMMLEAKHSDREDPIQIPLTPFMKSAMDDEVSRTQLEYGWDLASWSLSPGDVLAFHVQAADNYADGVTQGQVGKSATLHLKVISENDFDNQIRDELAALSDRVREVYLEQQEVKDQTDSILNELHSGSQDSAGSVNRAVGLGDREIRLVRRLTELTRQMSRLSRRIADNTSVTDSTDTLKRVKTTMQRLGEVATGAMTEAASALRASGGDGQPSESTIDNIQLASEGEQTAIDELARVLDEMGQEGGLQELFTSARAMLDRQRELQRQTRQIGQRTLGKSPETLNEQEQSELRTLQRHQLRLAEEAKQMTSTAREALDALRTTDPENAELLEKALRMAQSGAVERDMNEAAAALSENKTSAAGVSQKSAQASLEKILEAIQENRSRQLAELKKKIDEAEDLVAQFLKEQQELRLQTEALDVQAEEAEVFVERAETQRLLKSNTALFSEELISAVETLEPGRLLRSASEPMAQAEVKLLEMTSAGAIGFQDQAIRLLQQVVDDLRARSEQAEQERLTNSLSLLAGRFRELREAQQSINEETDQLHSAVAERGRMDRAETRRAALLAGRQEEQRVAGEEVRQGLSEVPVYDYVMATVTTDMERSRQSLDQRKVDEELRVIQGGIVRHLDRLLAALDQTMNMPKVDEFAEAGGSRGGNSSSSPDRAVPPLAELMVIKTLQVDLNSRTAAADAKANAAQDSEAHLQGIKKLGEEQQWLRELTRKVTEAARSGSGS